MNVISFFNSHYSHILYLHFFGFSEMKRKLICTIFIMVAGLFWLHIVNAQDTIVMGNKDLEIKGSLTVNQFFDKKNKLLTLEIKNEFNYKIMLSNPYSTPLFLLNYITEEEELLQVFCLVNNYLHPKGLFIFDLNTEYKFKEILAQNSFSEIKEDSAYIWENYYDEQENINEYYVNFFIKQKDGKYERKEEYHYQKAYDISIIKRLLEQSGLQLSAIYDAYTFEPPRKDSQRIYFVAREVQKTGNCDVLQEEMEHER